MPWENRFDVRTASQTRCYQQLIAKEAMRRRNEDALLASYRFRDRVTSMEGLASHWDGKVVRASSASAAGRQEAPPVQGKRALLHRQARSSVLQEGYAYGPETLSATGHSAHSTASSCVSDAFVTINPDSRERRTRERTRLMNKAVTEARVEEQRVRREKERAAREQAALLHARLSSVAAKGAYSAEDLAAASALVANAQECDAQTSEAVADVAPTSQPAQAAGSKSHGLRSCFGPTVRPMSAANRERLATRARSIFEHPPPLRHVAEARVRASQTSEAARSPALPRRLASAPATRRAPESVRSQKSIDYVARIESLEHELDSTRAQRDQMNMQLQQMCDALEAQPHV